MVTLMDSATCPVCKTLHTHLEVEHENGFNYVILSTAPCSDPDCHTLLCPSCDQFRCDACDHVFCAEHMRAFDDGTATPLHLCRACHADALQSELELPEPIPAQAEVSIPVAWSEVA
jgi:hypothetical protein